MRRRVAILAVLTALAGGAAQQVHGAPAEYSLKQVSNVSATYDPAQENQLPQSFSVTHKLPNQGSPTTSYFVTFSAGQSGNIADRTAQDASGNQLSYQLVADLTGRALLGDLSMVNLQAQNVLSGVSTISETIPASFSVLLNAGQLPPAGRFTDTVLVSIYGGTIASAGPVLDSTSMSLTFTVPSVLALSLVPTGSLFIPDSAVATMSFGSLQPGMTESMDLIVQSNASYSISLQSQNGSTLAITLTGDTSTVPYTLSFGGTPVTLPAATPATVVTTAPPTPGAGARYPIEVMIGSLGEATAGSYQDNITIVITAI